MKTTVISPTAVHALKEALTKIFWIKRDQQSFIHMCVGNSQILSRIDWNDTKRNISATLIDTLSANQLEHKNDLLNLLANIVEMRDFSHLEKFEDGEEKVKSAKKAVEALRQLSQLYHDLMQEKNLAEKRKLDAEVALEKKILNNAKLVDLKNYMFELIQSSNPQRRGYLLEKMIKELFDLFDLDPKASFKVLGEQIDGAFTFDNTDYLLEAKWEKSPLSLEPLYAFSMKVKNKLDNTLGLFIAINGFSAEAITKLSGGNCNIILMDGSDLMAVLEQQIKLPELLLRKRRHAAQTGNAFLTFRDF